MDNGRSRIHPSKLHSQPYGEFCIPSETLKPWDGDLAAATAPPDVKSRQANGSESSSYEHFTNSSNPISAQNNLNSHTSLYQDTLSMGGAAFFPSQNGFQQPVSTQSQHSAIPSWQPVTVHLTIDRTITGTISPICSHRTSQPKSSELSAQCS